MADKKKTAPPAAPAPAPGSSQEAEAAISEAIKRAFSPTAPVTPEEEQKWEAMLAEALKRNLLSHLQEAGLSASELADIEQSLTPDVMRAWVDEVTADWADSLFLYHATGDTKEKDAVADNITRLILALTKSIPEEKRFQAAQALKEAIPDLRTFSTIKQGIATNTLTKMKPVEGKNTTIDPITGTATISKGNFIITIPFYRELPGLKQSSYRLLDAITIAITESGLKSPTVIIPLSDYMEKCGLSDRKSAKEQAKADMETLRQVSITWEEKRGKQTTSYKFVNLADSGEIKRNGDIVFTFGATFYSILLGYPVMPYPPQLLRLNAKRNPNSFSMGRKILEHKNMNFGKKNENIISVNTLLEWASDIPSYEEVNKTDRHFGSRIIEPFERDLDALADTFTWEYCHSSGATLTDEELSTLDYHLFKDLLILIHWKNYPDQTQARKLERKAAALAAAAAEKPRPKPTKPAAKRTRKPKAKPQEPGDPGEA